MTPSREIKRLVRARRGGVLLEFAFSILILLLTLITTVEIGVEIFVRQSAERAASAATLHYGATRSMAATNAAVADAAPAMLQLCLQPISVRLYNTIQGVNLTNNTSGRLAKDNPGDDASADVARVTLVCEWQRMTPIVRNFLGPVFSVERSAFTRLRD